MRIERIQRKPGVVFVDFSKEGANGKRDEFTMKCHDDPNTSLDNSIKALTPHVIEMLELDKQWAETLHITQVGFGYKGESAVMGCIITGVKDLQEKKRPFPFNTPYAASKLQEATEGKRGRGRPVAQPDLLTPECVKALEKLHVEAEKYVIGQRMQLEFPLDNIAGVQASKVGSQNDLLEQAKTVIIEKQRATLPLVERACKIDKSKAAWVMEQLESEGFIGPPTGKGGSRDILVAQAVEQWWRNSHGNASDSTR